MKTKEHPATLPSQPGAKSHCKPNLPAVAEQVNSRAIPELVQWRWNSANPPRRPPAGFCGQCGSVVGCCGTGGAMLRQSKANRGSTR